MKGRKLLQKSLHHQEQAVPPVLHIQDHCMLWKAYGKTANSTHFFFNLLYSIKKIIEVETGDNLPPGLCNVPLHTSDTLIVAF